MIARSNTEETYLIILHVLSTNEQEIIIWLLSVGHAPRDPTVSSFLTVPSSLSVFCSVYTRASYSKYPTFATVSAAWPPAPCCFPSSAPVAADSSSSSRTVSSVFIAQSDWGSHCLGLSSCFTYRYIWLHSLRPRASPTDHPYSAGLATTWFSVVSNRQTDVDSVFLVRFFEIAVGFTTPSWLRDLG